MTIWRSHCLGPADSRIYWLRTADVRPALAGVLRWLDPKETARAAGFATQGLREDFLASRLLLRGVLAAWLGRAPGALTFVERPGGKPVLTFPSAPTFSLSHSSGVSALYVASHGELGLDVECVRPQLRNGLIALAQEYFAEDEYAWLKQKDDVAQQYHFLRLWTLKEAVLKAEGSGLALPLDCVAALPGVDGRPNWLALPERLANYQLKAGWLDLMDDCILAHVRCYG